MTDELVTEAVDLEQADVAVDQQLDSKGDAAEIDAALEKATEGAPESYDFTGIEDTMPEVIDAYKNAAKGLGLSNEKAQSILSKVLPVMAQAQAAQLETLKADWKDQSVANKEFGGDKLPESLAVAKKAMDAVGMPELTSFLNESGLGNHPLIFGAFYRLGKMISEDTNFISGGSGVVQQSIAQTMYPNMNP